MDKEERLADYILQHTSPEDDVLRGLFRETNLKVLYPRMVSGHLQGKLLEMLSHMIRPRLILEIGTYTGYSAICLARGMKPGGMLHTIEINDELKEMAIKYIDKAGLQDRIMLHTGDAMDVIPELGGGFDLVFIDGNKQEYLAYYHLVFPRLRPGGYILADNVLWDGKVVSSPKAHDKYTRGIIEFNDFLVGDDRVEQVILPLRDGFTVIRKLTD